MLEFLLRVFGKDGFGSKTVAKERLRLVLVHDRVNVSPQFLETLKVDLIRVINDYMEIDEQQMEITLDKSQNSVALIANIPVKCMKRPIHKLAKIG